MHKQPSDFHSSHRLIGVATTIMVHIAVVGWLLARQGSDDTDGAPAETIQWVNVRPQEVVVAPAPVTRATPLVRKEPVMRKDPVVRLIPAASAAPAAPERAQAAREEAPGAPSAPDAPAKSAYDLLQQARRDIGQIDQEIKKEFPEQRIKKPLDTPQERLEKGIALAHELAPPKWYQPAKVKELIDPGQYGRKRYRVTTALGTYCMTYESAHSPDGRDQATRNTAPKLTNCPEHEEPANPQKW